METPPHSQQPFRYERDFWCLLSWGFYAVNRLLLKPTLGEEVAFLHGQFNDALLIPAILPLLLRIEKLSGLRRHDSPPLLHEVVIYTALWSVLFEAVFPTIWPGGTADWLDVAAYAAGGTVAWVLWGRHIRQNT